MWLDFGAISLQEAREKVASSIQNTTLGIEEIPTL